MTAGGVARNARLTGRAGMVLLVLFAAEVVTVILGVKHVLTAHAVIGFLIAPVVVVKIASTGWRMVRYYRGDRAYRARGAPPRRLRVLGPVLIALTVTLLASGLVAYLGPQALHAVALKTHKVSFYPWLAVVIYHVIAHIGEAVKAFGKERAGKLGP